MIEQFNVQLGARSYPVYLGKNISAEFPAYIKRQFPGRTFALVTNETLAPLYARVLDPWRSELKPAEVIIPDGERYKTIDTWKTVLDGLLSARLDRKAVILAFGGGVVGDIAGFAAACYLRGVDYVQIPSTLLAMVDSIVGGKTGVDHAQGKNLVGAFHQPRAVWADTAFLDTLSTREFDAGFAELFKYAFIGGSAMFAFVTDNAERMRARERGPLVEGIRRSIGIKAHVVAGDEREETGRRAILNFGHTFAHALERECGYDGILHGEAVWWGMRCACDMGLKLRTVPEAARPPLKALVAKMIRPPLPKPVTATALYEAMFSDKKTAAGKLHFVVPAEPGSVVIKNDIAKEAVLDTLEYMISRS